MLSFFGRWVWPQRFYASSPLASGHGSARFALRRRRSGLPVYSWKYTRLTLGRICDWNRATVTTCKRMRHADLLSLDSSEAISCTGANRPDLSPSTRDRNKNHRIQLRSCPDVRPDRVQEFQPHRSHRDGLQVDVRTIRKDSREVGCSIGDPQYDQAATAVLIGLFLRHPYVQGILFNDASITGVRPSRGHDDHFHVGLA